MGLGLMINQQETPEDLAMMQRIQEGKSPEIPCTNEELAAEAIGSDAEWRKVKDVAKLLDEAETRGAEKVSEHNVSVAKLTVRLEDAERNAARMSVAHNEALTENILLRREVASLERVVAHLKNDLIDAKATAAQAKDPVPGIALSPSIDKVHLCTCDPNRAVSTFHDVGCLWSGGRRP